MRYTNWHGICRTRTITPKEIWFGPSPYHNGAQWFLTGWDHDRQAQRDFALKDCVFDAG